MKRTISLLIGILLLLLGTANYAQPFLNTGKLKPDFPGGGNGGYGAEMEFEGNTGMVLYLSRYNDTTFLNRGAVYFYEKDVNQQWQEAQVLTPPDDNRGVWFWGSDIALSGNFAVVGDEYSSLDSLGNDSLYHAGAAYIYKRDGSGYWNFYQKISPPYRRGGARYGHGVELKGNELFITDQKDSIYYYTLQNNRWDLRQIIPPVYGSATQAIVGLNNLEVHGDYLAMGVTYDSIRGGVVHFYKKDQAGVWNNTQNEVSIHYSDAGTFGNTLNFDGNYCVIGSNIDPFDTTGMDSMQGAGSVYIYERDTADVWNFKQKLTARTRGEVHRYGYSVSIEDDRLLVGSLYDGTDENDILLGVNYKIGSAYLYKLDQFGEWRLQEKFLAHDRANNMQFGWSVRLHGNSFFVSAPSDRLDEQGNFVPDEFGSIYTYLFGTHALAYGNVTFDDNFNCQKDSLEPGFKTIIQSQLGIVSSGDTGAYILPVLPGQTTTIKPVFSQWIEPLIKSVCPDSIVINIDTSNGRADTFGLNFSLEVDTCPLLRVDVGSNRRRPCFQTNTHVTVFNEGLRDVFDLQVVVKLPSFSTLTSASLPYTNDSAGNYIFVIDTLTALSQVDIQIEEMVDCTPEITGRIQCIRAWLPNANLCYNSLDSLTALWDSSNIVADDTCRHDSILRYVILNQGANMQDSLTYDIFFDNLLVNSGSFILSSNDSIVLEIPVNGQTVHLDVQQSTGNPENIDVSITTIGCGNGGQPLQNGLPILMPTNDDDLAFEMHCLVITNSYDPNDKKVQPEGITTNNYVPGGTLLDYQVRFQNTGTDTAYRVVIRDTLDPNLDITTFQPGVSSHQYQYSISGGDTPIVVFGFYGINLPDSNVDLAGSNGFVKYKIAPFENTPQKTEIHNEAAIYFDFNDPIYTNDAWVTIFDTVLHGMPVDINVFVSCGDSVKYDLATDNFHLTANATDASYLWVLCDSVFTPISTEDNVGNYIWPGMWRDFALIITKNGCVDTSACYTLLPLGIEANEFGNDLKVYPNPTDGKLMVEFAENQQNVTIELMDLSGRIIKKTVTPNESQIPFEIDSPAGTYLLMIRNEAGQQAIFRLIKH